MKKIVPMLTNEFTALLCTLQEGVTIEFGLTCDSFDESEGICPNDVSEWYFARIIRIPEYESRFILIDYCGGEDAFAIPLNCYSNRIDEDDKWLIELNMNKFYGEKLYRSTDEMIYVEMEEEE